jgi:hypothetical protein
MYQLCLYALALQLPKDHTEQGGGIAVPMGAAVECHNLHEIVTSYLPSILWQIVFFQISTSW